MHCLDEYVSFAEYLADLVRPVLIEAYETGFDYEEKNDGSPVTEVDKRIEEILRKEILAHYPEHGILGEEFGSQGLDKDFIWVIDPIDGTRSFTAGLPTFGSLIALCYLEKPVLGIIEAPIARLRAVGVTGRPTLCNGKPVRVRDCMMLEQAVLSDWTNNAQKPDELGAERLKNAVNWSVRDGGCIGYISLARGFIDLCIDGNLDAYDFCALVPVIEGAGGIITDWNGLPLKLSSGPLVVAAGSVVCHEQAMQLLQQNLTSEM